MSLRAERSNPLFTCNILLVSNLRLLRRTQRSSQRHEVIDDSNQIRDLLNLRKNKKNLRKSILRFFVSSVFLGDLVRRKNLRCIYSAKIKSLASSNFATSSSVNFQPSAPVFCCA